MSLSSRTPDKIGKAKPSHIYPQRWKVGAEIRRGRRIIRIIKSGGMGDVYIVRSSRSGLTSAMKIPKADKLKTGALDRFIEEMERWVSLGKHTNIVHPLIVDHFNRKPAILLEYVDDNLSQYIQKTRKLDIAQVIDYSIQLCNGLDYAYRKAGIVHNDIKPSNIMISPDGILKVTDFGISLVVLRDVGDQHHPQGGSSQFPGGTTLYMAPECYPERTKRKYSYRFRRMGITSHSDIFSFGVTLYQMLTGRLPFQTKQEVFQCVPCAPKVTRPDTPRELGSLIMRCLEKDPTKRYGSFEELMRILIKIYDRLQREQKIFGDKYIVKGGEEPDDGVAWHSLGLVRGAIQGRHREANDCFDRSLLINPECEDAWHSKGISHVYLEEWEQAKQCFSRALDISTRDPKVWCLKGACHVNLEEWDQAKECFTQALGIKPKYTDAWYSMGISHGQLGEWEQAKQCFERILNIRRRDADAWYYKGEIHVVLKEWETAKQCFARALEIRPKYADAWSLKGISYTNLEEWKQAKECFARALNIKPKYGEAWYIKGISHLYLGEWEQAQHCFGQAVDIEPKDTDARYGKGISYENLGEWEQAKECFKRVLDINPQYFEAWYDKGLCHMRLQEDGDAKDCFVRFVDLASPEMTVEIKAAKEYIQQLSASP